MHRRRLPGIGDVLGNCSDGLRTNTFYTRASDAPRSLQESGISLAMLKILA